MSYHKLWFIMICPTSFRLSVLLNTVLRMHLFTLPKKSFLPIWTHSPIVRVGCTSKYSKKIFHQLEIWMFLKNPSNRSTPTWYLSWAVILHIFCDCLFTVHLYPDSSIECTIVFSVHHLSNSFFWNPSQHWVRNNARSSSDLHIL